MSDRIGGAFPEDREGNSGRPGGAGRPGERRTSFSSGSRSFDAGGRASRPGGSGRFGAQRPGADRDRDRSYDRGEDRRSMPALPRIPESVTEDQLSREVADELKGLPADLAATVGRYLVAAELASDPEQAYRYAHAARHYAARIGVVREVVGITAYQTGRWSEALAELRAARRLTGRNDYLALMADSERGLGRLDRALDLVRSPEAKLLPRAAQIELRIVESGIRRDQGLADAAVLVLQVPELTDGKMRPWSARLFYAYGDALLTAGRPEAAREAFSRAVVADEDEQTDALARLDELDGITVQDLEEDEEDEDELEALTEEDEDEDEDLDDEDLDDEADVEDEEDEDLDDEDLDDDEDDLEVDGEDDFDDDDEDDDEEDVEDDLDNESEDDFDEDDDEDDDSEDLDDDEDEEIDLDDEIAAELTAEDDESSPDK